MSPAKHVSKTVLSPNLGVYLDRPALSVPERGMTDCRNVRIKRGMVVNENMGWTRFFQSVLNGHVTLIDTLVRRSGAQFLIFGTPSDLYAYDSGAQTVAYLTPRYEAGTVSVTNANAIVVGVGTSFIANAKAGDQLFVGAIGKTDPAAAWVTVQSVTDDTHLVLTVPWSGTTLATQAYTLRQRFTAGRLNPWSGINFQNAPGNVDLWIGTNGIDVPVKWDGTATQVTRLTGLGFSCRTLCRYKNMVLYGDITVAGQRKPGSIRNSAIGDPENCATLEAGEFVVTDGPHTLKRLGQLGDFAVGYCDLGGDIVLIQFVGPPTNFVIRTAVRGKGITCARAGVEFPDHHQILSLDGAYRFDGFTATLIGTQVFREALRSVDPSRYDQALAFIDEQNGEVVWVIPQTTDPNPSTGGPSTAYTAHYLEDVGQSPTPMAIRDLTATAVGSFQRESTLRFSDLPLPFSSYNFRFDDRFFQAAFPFILFGDANGKVYTLGTEGLQDGAVKSSFARFSRFPVGGPNGRKGIIRRVEPFASQRPGASYPLYIFIYGCDQAGGTSAAIAGPLAYDLTQAGDRFVCPRASARFAELMVIAGIHQPWELSGYSAEVAPAGLR